MINFALKVVKKSETCAMHEIRDFSIIIDEMLEKFEDSKSYVFESIGITEKHAKNAKFTKENFRRALNFYCKENSNRHLPTF